MNARNNRPPAWELIREPLYVALRARGLTEEAALAAAERGADAAIVGAGLGIGQPADVEIVTLAADLRSAHAEAEAAVARFRALQPGRRLRTADVGPSWSDWLLSADGAAYAAAVERFEAVADQLIAARPETLAGYCVKLEALQLADLEQVDLDRLAVERAELIAAREDQA